MSCLEEICYDRELPPELEELGRALAIEENPDNADGRMLEFANPAPLALETKKLWKPGRALRVRFLDGVQALNSRVIAAAKGWESYTNIKIVHSDADAEIRVTYRQSGSWSYLGTDCLAIPRNQATMCYGWLTSTSSDAEVQRVVLHEFGHALACIHEHQNPAGGIQWNTDAVYRYYGGPPNNWTREQIDSNLLRKYSADLTQFTKTDPTSIMHYPLPASMTLNGYSAGLNSKLSTMDKEFIAKIYPGVSAPPPPSGKIDWPTFDRLITDVDNTIDKLKSWRRTAAQNDGDDWPIAA